MPTTTSAPIDLEAEPPPNYAPREPTSTATGMRVDADALAGLLAELSTARARIVELEARDTALVAAVDESIAVAQAVCNMGPIDTTSTEKVSRDDHPWLPAPAMYLDRAAPAWLQRLEKLRDAKP